MEPQTRRGRQGRLPGEAGSELRSAGWAGGRRGVRGSGRAHSLGTGLELREQLRLVRAARCHGPGARAGV